MCLYWHLQPSLRFQLVTRRLLSTSVSQAWLFSRTVWKKDCMAEKGQRHRGDGGWVLNGAPHSQKNREAWIAPSSQHRATHNVHAHHSLSSPQVSGPKARGWIQMQPLASLLLRPLFPTSSHKSCMSRTCNAPPSYLGQGWSGALFRTMGRKSHQSQHHLLFVSWGKGIRLERRRQLPQRRQL